MRDLDERDIFLRRRAEQRRPVGIKFHKDDHDLGFDILLSYGSVNIWIGNEEAPIVYVMERKHADEALNDLDQAEVNYWINYQLPPTISFAQGKRLAELPGWQKKGDSE